MGEIESATRAILTGGGRLKAKLRNTAKSGITTFIDSIARSSCAGRRKRQNASEKVALSPIAKTKSAMLSLSINGISVAKVITFSESVLVSRTMIDVVRSGPAGAVVV